MDKLQFLVLIFAVLLSKHHLHFFQTSMHVAKIYMYTVTTYCKTSNQWRRQREEASPLWVYGKIGRQLTC